MDPELVAAIEKIGPVVISFGGLVIAGLSLGLNFMNSESERRAAHRSQLYMEQLPVYQELFRSAFDCFGYCFGMVSNNNSKLNDETFAAMLHQMRERIDALQRVYAYWLIMLPGEFSNLMTRFLAVVHDIAKADNRDIIAARSQEFQIALTSTFLPLTGFIRRSIGVEPLSQDMLNLIGRS